MGEKKLCIAEEGFIWIPTLLASLSNCHSKRAEQLTVSEFLLALKYKVGLVISVWWLGALLFFHVSGILIPTDFYFLRGLKPPTRYKWQKSQELCSHKFTCDDLFEGENTIMTRRFAFFVRRQTTSGRRWWKVLVMFSCQHGVEITSSTFHVLDYML